MKRIIITKKAYTEMVRSVLDAVLDQTVDGLPPFCSYEQRCKVPGTNDPTKLGSYERGVLEGAGMTLGIINVRFGLKGFPPAPDDGIGIIDALEMADGFHSKVEHMFHLAWKDEGKAIKAVVDSYAKLNRGWKREEVLFFYPDTTRAAEVFVKEIIKAEMT